jgi:uncharacterized protein (TIGR03066 family)
MILPHFARWLCTGLILTVAPAFLSSETASAAPVPKSNRTKILGVWELTKSEAGVLPKTTLEFTRDGKLKIAIEVDDKPVIVEGTYKVEGDKLTITVKAPDEDKESTDTATITKLTDKELITKDEKGKIDEFRKKK